MKILLLTKKFPYPLLDGESLAIHNLSHALAAAGARITMLSMNTTRHPGEHLASPPRHLKKVHTVEIDNRVKPFPALKHLIAGNSYHIERFISEAYREKLKDLLTKEKFDVIQLETVYLAPYIETIRQHSKAAIAMRAHNVEHEIWERIALNTRPGPRRWYLNHLSEKLEAYERNSLRAYDFLLPISERDEYIYNKMGYKGVSQVIPIGIQAAKYLPNYKVFSKSDISFIGSLDWMPNLEGLRWFLDEIWPKIYAVQPHRHFHIAGRGTPEWLMKADIEGVTVHGTVPNAANFLNSCPIMVTPLLSGSGMRAKILEAMALGRVIVTTTIGKEGISAEHGNHLFVADSAEDFVRCFDFLDKKQDELVTIGRRARAYVVENFDHNQIGQKLMKTYQSLQPVPA